MRDLGGVHHVALTVADCAASSSWYRRTFGMVELFSEEGPTRRARVLGFAHGRYSVGLVEHATASANAFDPTRCGLDHLAFTVQNRDELLEWAAHLTRLEIHHSGVIDVPVGAIVNLIDPDGIAIALFADAGD